MTVACRCCMKMMPVQDKLPWDSSLAELALYLLVLEEPKLEEVLVVGVRHGRDGEAGASQLAARHAVEVDGEKWLQHPTRMSCLDRQ